MPVYTVHAPADAPLSSGHADRITFIRDGFHFWALVFGPFWLLVNRLWLAFIGYIVVVGSLEVMMALLRVPTSARLLVMVLIAVLMGIEAANIKRWSYSRRRWREIGLVVGDDEEMAERRFFEQRGFNNNPQADAIATQTLPPFPPPSYPPASPPRYGDRREIIGLFPEPGGTR
jgi:hypothetical protein